MLDIIIIVIFAAFILYGFFRGLVMTAFSIASFIASLIIAGLAYPYIAKLIRAVGVYDGLKDKISGNIGENVSNALAQTGGAVDKTFFELLNLPAFLTNGLVNNNTPAVHGLLQTSDAQNYVSGFLANAVISVIAMIITLIVVFAIIRLIGAALNVASKLPVINTFNKIGGAVFGAILGFGAVWLLLAVFIVLAAQGNAELNDMLAKSALQKYFHNLSWINGLLAGIIR